MFLELEPRVSLDPKFCIKQADVPYVICVDLMAMIDVLKRM
jgi:hypothetical protein